VSNFWGALHKGLPVFILSKR